MAREDRESYVELTDIDTHINHTALQYTEIISTDRHRYLVIHRNGSSTVRSCIADSDNSTTGNSIILWTVLRDPYDRFIDAVAYDIEYAGIEVSNNVLDTLVGTTSNIRKYICDLSVNEEMRNDGFVKHSNLQLTYLFDNRVDMYVDLQDLDAFCKIHFPNTSNVRVNTENTKDKDLVRNYFDGKPELKEYVQGVISIDYIMINRLEEQQKKWEWYMGKVF
jgi:hypothetical protein